MPSHILQMAATAIHTPIPMYLAVLCELCCVQYVFLWAMQQTGDPSLGCLCPRLLVKVYFNSSNSSSAMMMIHWFFSCAVTFRSVEVWFSLASVCLFTWAHVNNSLLRSYYDTNPSTYRQPPIVKHSSTCCIHTWHKVEQLLWYLVFCFNCSLYV